MEFPKLFSNNGYFETQMWAGLRNRKKKRHKKKTKRRPKEGQKNKKNEKNVFFVFSDELIRFFIGFNRFLIGKTIASKEQNEGQTKVKRRSKEDKE